MDARASLVKHDDRNRRKGEQAAKLVSSTNGPSGVNPDIAEAAPCPLLLYQDAKRTRNSQLSIMLGVPKEKGRRSWDGGPLGGAATAILGRLDLTGGT
jgi:hypothetical protein